MEAIFLLGTMFSGKTSSLVHALQLALERGEKALVVEHPANTRNSARDLVRCVPFHLLAGLDDPRLDAPCDLVCFDETHFYECFSNKHVLFSLLPRLQAKAVLFAGLQYDFYNALAEFKVWNDLSKSGLFSGIEVRPLFTHNPCCGCGKFTDVHFTVNVDPRLGRVGDHYKNACKKCAEKYFSDFQDYHKCNRQ